MSFEQVGDVMHPKTRCRGCAGLGIGQHVTPRVIQVIEGIQAYQWLLDPPPGGRRRQRFIRVTPIVYDQSRQQGVFYGPFAAAYAEMQRRLGEGFTIGDGCVPMEADWTCQWCHGTGQPQLSIATLEMAMQTSSSSSDRHNGGQVYDGG